MLSIINPKPTNFKSYSKNTQKFLNNFKIQYGSLDIFKNLPIQPQITYAFFNKLTWKNVLVNTLTWKRSLRYTITLVYDEHVVLNLTFRKLIGGSIKEHTIKTRWLVHSFFFFKNIFFFNKINEDLKVFFFFYNTNSFFFNNQNFFFENYNYFFKKLKHKFIFFFYPDFISYKLNTFKKIKSIRKFKRKMYSMANRKHINFLLKSVK